MRRYLITIIICIAAFLLQCSVFPWFNFNGIVPNVLIIVTAAFGFMRGKKNGLFTGLLCGLLLDIFFGEVIGLYALFYTYIGFANGYFRKLFYPEDIKLPLGLISMSDLIYNLLYYCVLFLLRSRFRFDYYLINIIIPEMIYTVSVSLLIYPVVLRINNKLEEIEKRSAKKFV